MKVPAMIETKVTSSLKGSVLDLIQKDYQFILTIIPRSSAAVGTNRVISFNQSTY